MPSALVDVGQWNERCPVGTQVRFWASGSKERPSQMGVTRSTACLTAGAGVPVVFVKGFGDGHTFSYEVPLTHVEPTEANAADDDCEWDEVLRIAADPIPVDRRNEKHLAKALLSLRQGIATAVLELREKIKQLDEGLTQ